MVFLNEVVERNSEQHGNLHEDPDIGHSVPLFPFRNGLILIIQLFRELELRHIRHFSQARDIFADDHG